MQLKFNGIIPATLTPMLPNGNINISQIPNQVNYLKQMGASGLFINGTTGESASLTISERMELAEAYQKSAEHILPLIIHVGHNCIEDSRKLVLHASSLSVKAVAFSPPSFFNFNDAETLIEISEKIMSDAPEMPFYYYHIPSISGINVSIKDFLIKADSRLPSLAGIKYTSEQIDTFLDCQLSFADRFELMFGRDEMLLMGLAGGAKAFVGSTFNYSTQLYLQIIRAFENNEIETAQKLQHKSIKMIDILQKHGGAIRFGKIVMKILGIDLGPARLPFSPFDEAEIEIVKQKLTKIDFSIKRIN